MKNFLFLTLIFFGSVFSFADNAIPPALKSEDAAKVKVSWYGDRFHGRLTASGAPFNMHAMTAAHKKLPFGTKVKITNTRNGKSVVVTINDRGPYVGKRKFDLSKAAFHKIAKAGTGIITATYEIL